VGKEQGDKLHNCEQHEDASGPKQLTLLLMLWSAMTRCIKEKRYMTSIISFFHCRKEKNKVAAIIKPRKQKEKISYLSQIDGNMCNYLQGFISSSTLILGRRLNMSCEEILK
jgi:hypothetical protein